MQKSTSYCADGSTLSAVAHTTSSTAAGAAAALTTAAESSSTTAAASDSFTEKKDDASRANSDAATAPAAPAPAEDSTDTALDAAAAARFCGAGSHVTKSRCRAIVTCSACDRGAYLAAEPGWIAASLCPAATVPACVYTGPSADASPGTPPPAAAAAAAAEAKAADGAPGAAKKAEAAPRQRPTSTTPKGELMARSREAEAEGRAPRKPPRTSILRGVRGSRPAVRGELLPLDPLPLPAPPSAAAATPAAAAAVAAVAVAVATVGEVAAEGPVERG